MFGIGTGQFVVVVSGSYWSHSSSGELSICSPLVQSCGQQMERVSQQLVGCVCIGNT